MSLGGGRREEGGREGGGWGERNEVRKKRE